MTEQTPPPDTFDARAFLRTAPDGPGVYRMLNAEGEILYVGKARNLRRRLSSYFVGSRQQGKTAVLVRQIRAVELTLTHTEAEALILENNLIKRHKPRYNVLLRDDKSYPYIYLSSKQRFPRLATHRGARRAEGRYFGPYPNARAVRETLNHLQKVFPVRQCEDSFFANRTRPCLQYQIKRCTAPCVDFISPEAYREDVRHAEMFLEGKSDEVIQELVRQMERHAERRHFEQAAQLRDRIAALRSIQERQYIIGAKGDLDVVACVAAGGQACVQVFFFRAGHNLGNKSYFPRAPADMEEADLLAAFLAQYYLGKRVPKELIISHPIAEKGLLEEALSRENGHKVSISHALRGERRRWLAMARENAVHALQARHADRASMLKRFEALQDALALDELPERIECFDISHTRGEATVASCVVFNREGALKSDYRRFNIEGIAAGDDYAAMRQALTRRYTRLKSGEGVMPDLLLVDGGKGQLRQAREVLEELQVEGLAVLGIAKGPERRPGEETLFLLGREGEVQLPPNSPALHLLQQVRDEAHRFAITGHRARRGRKRTESALESIPGLGPKRRASLLKQFGGLQAVSRAGVEDLARVPGLSRTLAQKIYDVFHSE
ncbi:excinuclease ABC subunit UvrC [Alkalilimnicola sp. S0819]|uniref:excinuclease ABC subunit UvrC n=1 Tax=Alkalilimnicola sp. S0819 TaxID=2613922 RepID=UPI001261E518|nr:excinuclease ABC subunit UvrC [Alkalilimnicola sp. S0819]KAB7627572.1 excinuclease ABC subunit UvrC [Alkalilimnicola sp. S0819]MPQ15731.1 excinuclease ABC subunit UvrC [Alkalilimnicola sp. S0819]